MTGVDISVPSGPELIERARLLAPTIRDRADATTKNGALLPENIGCLQKAGFFRCLQPKRWGGYEVHPNVFFEITRLIGAACPSTAWVLSVVGVHNWQLALFPWEAQQDVWQENPRTLIASSYMPVGKVTPVEGGFQLSGTWGFSSGIDHCPWVFLGGLVPGEGERRDLRTFLVPKADFEIIDDWQVTGLEGTGSKTVTVNGAFVPNHRTHKFRDGFMQDSPGNEFNPAALYRIPFGQIFVRTITSSGIGMLTGALQAFTEVQKSRMARSTLSKVAERPSVQVAVAQASAVLKELRLVQQDQFRQIMNDLEAGRKLSMDDRVQWRYEAARVSQQASLAIDGLFKASGGSAIFKTNAISRYFNDIHAAGAHYANDSWDPSCNLGRVLFGQDSQDFFI